MEYQKTLISNSLRNNFRQQCLDEYYKSMQPGMMSRFFRRSVSKQELVLGMPQNVEDILTSWPAEVLSKLEEGNKTLLGARMISVEVGNKEGDANLLMVRLLDDLSVNPLKQSAEDNFKFVVESMLSVDEIGPILRRMIEKKKYGRVVEIVKILSEYDKATQRAVLLFFSKDTLKKVEKLKALCGAVEKRLEKSKSAGSIKFFKFIKKFYKKAELVGKKEIVKKALQGHADEAMEEIRQKNSGASEEIFKLILLVLKSEQCLSILGNDHLTKTKKVKLELE